MIVITISPTYMAFINTLDRKQQHEAIHELLSDALSVGEVLPEEFDLVNNQAIATTRREHGHILMRIVTKYFSFTILLTGDAEVRDGYIRHVLYPWFILYTLDALPIIRKAHQNPELTIPVNQRYATYTPEERTARYAFQATLLHPIKLKRFKQSLITC